MNCRRDLLLLVIFKDIITLVVDLQSGEIVIVLAAPVIGENLIIEMRLPFTFILQMEIFSLEDGKKIVHQ